MLFDVYIQDKFYQTIEANNTGEVLTQVAIDISQGKVEVNPNFPQNIKIEPASQKN